MKDTCECPKCEMGNAYFDGVIFICPDCEYQWSNDTIGKTTDNLNYSSNYESLIKLKQPFFKLKHGKLYDCKIEHKHGNEESSIFPLAFEEGKNRQFVMIDARRLYKENADFVKEIIKMDFDYIWNDGIESDYPFDYHALTILCSTHQDGTLVDYNDDTLFDFKETDLI